LVVIAMLAVLATACGGASDSGSGVATLEEAVGPGGDTVASLGEATRTPPEPPSDEEALLAFAACVRENGIDIEDPTIDADGNLRLGGLRGAAAGGDDRETLRAAFGACRDQLEGVALGFRRDGIDRTERDDALLAYAACMRENGYDMPDPDLDFAPDQGGGPGEGAGTFTGPFGEIDREDPAFGEAQAACEDVLAGFGRGPGGGPGGGGA
jgi:hypothetical protein